MNIQLIHPQAKVPTRGSEHAGGFDIYMPEAGAIRGNSGEWPVPLGFATEIPIGYIALLLPRSSAGGMGLELMNTCGVIDSDYRGQWIAKLHYKREGSTFAWGAGDRLLQFVIVPVLTPELKVVESVQKTERGAGGFGSTGS